MSSTAVDRLRRFASRATDHSSCDLCRSDLKDRHRHLLELVQRRMLCACDACSLLFSDGNGSRFRPIPESVTRIDLKLSDAEWTGLGIPIGMAFFTVREQQVTSPAPEVQLDRRPGPVLAIKENRLGDCQDRSWPAIDSKPCKQAGEVTADSSAVQVGYPSPAGPVMSSVEQVDWRTLLDANPDLSRLRPEVESLLINRTARRRQAFVVPLDVCFELIGIVRRDWNGWSGGPEVHRKIDRFFDQLEMSAGERVP